MLCLESRRGNKKLLQKTKDGFRETKTLGNFRENNRLTELFFREEIKNAYQDQQLANKF